MVACIMFLAAFGFVVLATLFVLQERRAHRPMLSLSLFRHPMFALTALVGLLVNIAFYGLIFVFSLYFQEINGWSSLATGLAFVAMMGACCRSISWRHDLPNGLGRRPSSPREL